MGLLASTLRKPYKQNRLGGCQNYGPFLDPYYNTAPNIEDTPKKDHGFDNHQFEPGATMTALRLRIYGLGI